VQTAGSALVDLATDLDEAMNAVGFTRERRPFHPHVTLGRVRGTRGLNALRRAVQEHEGFDAGEIPIDEVTLFESELGRGGARYTALGVHRLGNR